MIGLISKRNKTTSIAIGVTFSIYDFISNFYIEIAHFYITNLNYLNDLLSDYKIKEVICSFSPLEVKEEFKNVIFYENKDIPISEALNNFYEAKQIEKKEKENKTRSMAKYQMFVTEEERRLLNEYGNIDYLDDDDIGGS